MHASHRSNLLRKEPEYYTQFGWTEPPDLPYVWPVPMVKVEETTVVKKSRKKSNSAILPETAVTQKSVTVVTTDRE